jgi:hypothetical protein
MLESALVSFFKKKEKLKKKQKQEKMSVLL